MGGENLYVQLADSPGNQCSVSIFLSKSLMFLITYPGLNRVSMSIVCVHGIETNICIRNMCGHDLCHANT